MKTIGLIGGTSWHSTITYYRIINETVAEKLGGHHSAKIIMSSIDYESIARLAHDNDWNGITTLLSNEAKKLEDAGADFFLICANTLHKVAGNVSDKVNIPLLHIVDATAEEIKRKNLKKVGLLGTTFTMEDASYGKRLSQHGLETIVPDETARKEIHNIIFNELTKGIFTQESRNKYIKIISSLTGNGAQGIILGCTEIPLLICQQDSPIPIFDTTKIHSIAAAEMATLTTSRRNRNP